MYPFLLHGSTACASFSKLEKMGGKDQVIVKGVPEEVKDEVYTMLILTASNLFYFGVKPKLFTYDELFAKLHIKELTYFGADTSIRTSPHFVVLQAEIGHLVCTYPGKMREMGDVMFRLQPQFGLPDRELTFDRVTDSSPPEMKLSVLSHAEQKRQKRGESRLEINPEWLKKLREGDL